MTPVALADLIRTRAAGHARFIVALAGPPGAGKSTLSAGLAESLGAHIVPMDGFHYDDAVLNARGLRSRKGAPETYDVAGFIHLMQRLHTADEDVAIPVFDRRLELSRAGAEIVPATDPLLIVEGNYLLLNEPPWTDLVPFFDLTVMIDVPLPELDQRLLNRWAQYGKTPADARAWIDGNDMPNIRRVTRNSSPPNITLTQG